MAAGGVYMIRNNVNGKIYVGSTVNLKTRWYDHRTTLNCHKHANKYLQRAWLKYGADAFTFIVLEEVFDSSQLIKREQYYLDQLKPWVRSIGYNILPNAYSPKGVIVSVETRKKLSEANKGRPLSQEHREKLSKAHAGKKLTDEHKVKISKAGRGRTATPETRAKLSAARTGMHLSPETRQRLSQRPITPEMRLKMSKANTGREVKQATRDKISNSLKGFKHSAKTREKIASAAIKRQARYSQEQVAEMRRLKS